MDKVLGFSEGFKESRGLEFNARVDRRKSNTQEKLVAEMRKFERLHFYAQSHLRRLLFHG